MMSQAFLPHLSGHKSGVHCYRNARKTKNLSHMNLKFEKSDHSNLGFSRKGDMRPCWIFIGRIKGKVFKVGYEYREHVTSKRCRSGDDFSDIMGSICITSVGVTSVK